MTGIGTSLTLNLTQFASLLRRLGVRTGTGEVIDALTALADVGLSDPALARLALKATLAKGKEEQEAFERLFDCYFVPPEAKAGRQEELRARAAAQAKQAAAVSRDLAFQGAGLNLTGQQIEAYARLSEEEQSRLRDFVAESAAGAKVGPSFQPLIEQIVKGHLRRKMRQNGRAEPAPLAPSGDPLLDDILSQAAGRGSAGEALIHLDIAEIGRAEFAEAAQLVRKLARRLAGRISRRYRLTARRAQLDLRRTIRGSVSTGGIPFRLAYRRQRADRPRLVVICDVSGSMARYLTFILLFLFGLTSVVRAIDIFAFGEQLERLDLRAGTELELQVERALASSRVAGKGTDLAQALETLHAQERARLTPGTFVLVVSDTKTLHAEQAAALLGRVLKRVRGMLWLCPLPESEWPPAAKLFAAVCPLVECRTIADLGQAFGKRLGRL